MSGRYTVTADVVGYPYTVALPFEHGITRVQHWLSQQGIDYRWNSTRDDEELGICYYFRDTQDVTLFLLRWT